MTIFRLFNSGSPDCDSCVMSETGVCGQHLKERQQARRAKPDPHCPDCVLPDGQLLGRACQRHNYDLRKSLAFMNTGSRMDHTFFDAFGGN